MASSERDPAKAASGAGRSRRAVPLALLLTVLHLAACLLLLVVLQLVTRHYTTHELTGGDGLATALYAAVRWTWMAVWAPLLAASWFCRTLGLEQGELPLGIAIAFVVWLLLAHRMV